MEKEVKIDLGQVLKDELFKGILRRKIDELLESYYKRPPAKPGYHYVKTGVDSLIYNSSLNFDFFYSNISDIWLKKSSISSRERAVIKQICDLSVMEFVKLQQWKKKN